MKAKRVVIAVILAVVSVIGFVVIAFFMLTSPMIKIAGWQELDLNKLERIHKTVDICDAEGNVIVGNMYDKNKIFVDIKEVPQSVRDAFISIEDKRFYKHGGVDYVRMLGAVKNNLRAASLKEGASTITQQLIKNTHLTNEKTFLRKFQEIRIAKELEKVFSKEDILEAYLNVLYFGNNVYGIAQAANFYFEKKVCELNVHESATLAGMINNPYRFNPLTHPEQAVKRRNVVIDRMRKNGKIDENSANAEKKTPLEICRNGRNLYSAYIENVIDNAAESLDCLPEELYEKGVTIFSCLNKEQFDKIYSSMSDILYENDYKKRVVIVRNPDAKVICDVSNAGTADVIRQPGSTIKPFVSYAPALEKKLVFPVSVVKDEKTEFEGGYSPRNFEDKYYGNITVSDSLKYSLNVPAVKLTDMCGVSYCKSVARRFGVPFSGSDNGLAIALGGLTDGMTLNQLVDAYSTLARGGKYARSRYVQSVYVDGERVFDSPIASNQAVREDTAYLITEMLRECAQSGTAKKLSEFNNVAAKTGTVERGNKNSDAYCIAYTPNYTVGVWYGDDGDGDDKIYGGKQPASVAASVLRKLNDVQNFTAPNSVEKLDIDIKKLQDEGAVYLAAPTLAKRYRQGVYFSKFNLPNRFSYGDIPYFFDDGYDSNYFDDFEIVDSFAY